MVVDAGRLMALLEFLLIVAISRHKTSPFAKPLTIVLKADQVGAVLIVEVQISLLT